MKKLVKHAKKIIKIDKKDKELQRLREQGQAIINICLGNTNQIIKGDFAWSRALEYVKLLREHYDNSRKEIDLLYCRIGLESMPIDLNKETEYAYQAYLEESSGVNEKGIALPKYRELPEIDRQRFMAMAEFLITKFSQERDKKYASDWEPKRENIQGNSSESELESEPKPKSKSKSTR
jgi:hypothetical protein